MIYTGLYVLGLDLAWLRQMQKAKGQYNETKHEICKLFRVFFLLDSEQIVSHHTVFFRERCICREAQWQHVLDGLVRKVVVLDHDKVIVSTEQIKVGNLKTSNDLAVLTFGTASVSS